MGLPVIAGEAIAMDPPFGNVTGTHYFCMDDLFNASTGLCTSGTPPGQASFGIGTPAYVTFVPALYLLDTRTDIVLNPLLNTPSGLDGVVYTFQTTSGTAPGAVPEPGTTGLIAAGLIVLIRARSRLRTTIAS